MTVDLNLLERWLTAWSLSRGLPLPVHESGGLAVDVGWPDQLRRHVFLDAGPAMQACAAAIRAPFTHIKAPVLPEQMQASLPPGWVVEELRYLMACNGPMTATATPEGYTVSTGKDNGARFINLCTADGTIAASGRVVLHGATAVFDRIETHEQHRRKGLASAVMLELDALARQACVSERLLVATEAGRPLYLALGWHLLAPYSTFIYMGT
ncbi:GNAT family N-acetyltransferase [Massilia sp. CF038]|uniref:GNAT family N-acetyltransferase n=1 Tax=Massilia sp. CF038 TaxID=1881045 RepID=UPI00091CED34|nr:GNAT family N-acetyltransferase [Massilia sp. CF038]SHG51053.1 Acetyltransferase (GNAT) family protein [Massilia sp. CF038]